MGSRAFIESNAVWKLPALLRKWQVGKALVVAPADKVFDQHAQRMWMELLKVGAEAYIIRTGEGYPDAATVEDGANVLSRTGVSSIVCIGSLGVQEAAKAMRTMHCTGATTMEAAVDRLQSRQTPLKSSIPITFIPTDLSPPAWSRQSTLCFHPTVPAVTTLAPCAAPFNVCYDPEFISECMNATKSTGVSLLGMVAAAIDAEAMAPSFVSNTLPDIDFASKNTYSSLAPQIIEQLAHWNLDALSRQYGHFYGALELASLFSQNSALQTNATLATAQAVHRLLLTLEQHEDDLNDGDVEEPMYATLWSLRDAIARVLKSPSLSVDDFSGTVDHVLQQRGAQDTLPLADIDTAIDVLQSGCPSWMDVLGFQAHSENDGFERTIRLIASPKE